MKTLLALLLASASLAACGVQRPAPPPSLPGTWQATLRPAEAPKGLRMVVRITPAKAGGWDATMYLINANPIPVQSVLAGGSMIQIIGNLGRYQGNISGDGNSIRGTWIYGNPQPRDNPLAVELQRATPQTAWTLPADPSPHTTRYVTVDKDANLEVLDWGGTGRPVVLLAGLGSRAHVFDEFALKLIPRYHVYGITRRGFGNSSTPWTGYSADRLGDDVLAVLDALHIVKPILVGHSIAGEELSSIGSRYPQRVAGLVYLEAGYQYAYYDPKMVGDDLIRTIDIDELERELDQLKYGNATVIPPTMIQDLLSTDLPRVTQSLLVWQQRRKTTASSDGTLTPAGQEVMAGLQRYTRIPVPILAIFRDMPGWPQANLFKAVPSAHVVRLAHATHEIFRSNEAEVLREMNAFIGGLPQ